MSDDEIDIARLKKIETTELVDGPVARPRFLAAHEDPSLGAHVPEPQALEQPKGFPAYENTHKGQVYKTPPDGKLMSAGIEPYSALDGPVSPSGKPWPARTVTPGGTIQMVWWLTARHKPGKAHYWITKDGWDQSKPLSRDMLEPLCTIHGQTDEAAGHSNMSLPVNDVSHWIVLPKKAGRHIIYGVWDVADTANAFYQGVDVEFDAVS